GADYILAVKGNQKQLLQNVEEEFRFGKDFAVCEDVDLGHGRIETRRCSLISDFQFMAEDSDWANLKTVVRIESKREYKNSDSDTETMIKCYINSWDSKPNKLLHYI